VWLTFLVARGWLGLRAAVFATLCYAANVAAINTALNGLPPPLAAIALLLAFWLGFPRPIGAARGGGGGRRAAGGEGATASAVAMSRSAESAAWRLLLAGAACALAALTHYLLGTVAVALAWSLFAGERRRGRAVGIFLLGFVACAAPWMWRSY